MTKFLGAMVVASFAVLGAASAGNPTKRARGRNARTKGNRT